MKARTRVSAALGFLLVLILSASASAQPYPTGKNGEDTQTALVDLAGQGQRCIVTIYCDGELAALGTIVSAEGEILTKASELEGRIRCVLADGRSLTARRLAVDPDYDLALLQVDTKDDLPFLRWRPTPLETGEWVVTPLRGQGAVRLGVIGVLPRPLAGSAFLGVRLEDEGSRGVTISAVFPDTAASRAGLRANDVLIRVGDRQVSNRDQVISEIRKRRPKDQLEIAVRRADLVETITVELGKRLEEDRRSQAWNQTGPVSEVRSGFPSVFQHDTLLHPRDCGGPVLDLEGRAVGLNIARGGRIQTFAIPAREVESLLKRLRTRKSL